MNIRNLIIPIKYKFLSVLLFITCSGIGIFFYFTQEIFSEDKKLFVMDYNLTLLRAATSEIKLELRARLEELQVIIPRIYSGTADPKKSPFDGITTNLSDEILHVQFFKKSAEKKFERIKDYVNVSLLDKLKLTPNELSDIDKKHPLDLNQPLDNSSLALSNRSIRLVRDKSPLDLGVLSFTLPGTFVDSESRELVIVVDMLQDFLRKTLHQSDVAELFLINKNGTILSHSAISPTINFSSAPYPHPIVDRIKTKVFPRESFELTVEKDPYLVNISETGFNNVVAVSQIKKSDAFAAMQNLFEKSILVAALILCGATIITVIFASRLTSNIQRLQIAAEKIGAGNLSVKLNIHSNDEIQSVAKSFEWMVKRLKELVADSAQKARMEEELETARLVQSTILSIPNITSDKVEIASHYVPATECGGDLWDAYLDGDLLTVFIADATGHGAPAAIVTAVAKSCFSTLSSIYQGQSLAPDQFLTVLNQIIYSACRGKLLITMVIVQINLKTGELKAANAGHEPPLCLRSNKLNAAEENPDKPRKATADVLFCRGERLGYDPAATYQSETFNIETNDTVLLYTDGVSEARNNEGKEWGERNLKKALAAGLNRSIEQVKTQLVESIEGHTQGAPQQDDVTFVLVTLLGEVSGNQVTPDVAPETPTPEPETVMVGEIIRDPSGDDESGSEAA